jgi:hypothetical protein
MPFGLRRGQAPTLGLDCASYRPGDAVTVTVTVAGDPPGAPATGHVRLRCHRPRELALDPLVDPTEIAGCERGWTEIARAELAQAERDDDGRVRMTATIHLPPDAEPTCRGDREVAAWEVVAVVHRRAASTWLEVVPQKM